MSSYENFSSLPPDEERQFAVYEEHSQTAAKQAMKLGVIVGGAVAALVLLFALIVPYEKAEMEVDGPPPADQRVDELGAE